ncbi:MAG: carbon-nitrogen hydrolase family protein [Thermodesulfobacteriota bacterium]
MGKVLGGKDRVKVAVAQASPVFLDKDKTVEKACKLIEEAGNNGAELLAFPEAFIPGYPAYYTVGYETNPHEWTDYMIALQDNALSIPGEDTEILANAAKEADIHVVIGCSELDDRKGSCSLFNTLLFISREGKILGKHRKLMPTYTERLYWAQGDGSDLEVYETDIGRIGGLICWENHMILIRAHMIYSGQDFHVAVWPGNWKRGSEQLLNADTSYNGGACNLQSLIKVHAFESGAFVLSACGYLDSEDIPQRWHYIKEGDHFNHSWAHGGSAIVNPAGRYLFEPVFEKDAILYADCYANQIKAVKAVFDSLGHYSRWDVAKLIFKKEKLDPVIREEKKLEIKLDSDKMKRISDEHEISKESLQLILEELKQLID